MQKIKSKKKKKYDPKKESQNFPFYWFNVYEIGRVMSSKQLFKDALINISIW